MEDNFHHFGVRISHRDGVVTDVTAATRRAPWSTCGSAALKLRSLIGCDVVSRASDVGRLLEMRQHCTHMFDLAGLALAAIANATAHRVYEATVTMRHPKPAYRRPHTGRCTAVLWRDQTEVLRWIVDDNLIVDPTPERSLLGGFRAWSETLLLDDGEAATVLRRAVDVSGGLSIDVDSIKSPLELNMPSVCHSYQPDEALIAERNLKTSRDFSTSRYGMLDKLNSQFS